MRSVWHAVAPSATTATSDRESSAFHLMILPVVGHGTIVMLMPNERVVGMAPMS